MAARKLLRLGLDDLRVVAHEFLNPRLSRSGLHRTLKRRDVLATRRDTSSEDTKQTLKRYTWL